MWGELGGKEGMNTIKIHCTNIKNSRKLIKIHT